MSACVKCGGRDIGTRFHERGCSRESCICSTCIYGSHNKRHDEHLHRTCRDCGYDWTDDVAEAQR